MWSKVLYSTISFFLFTTIATGQLSFSDGSKDVFGDPIASTVASAIADIDGDTYDDIVFINNGDQLTVLAYRGKQVSYQKIYEDQSTVPNVWSMVAGDVDGDHRVDILVAAIDGVYSFTQIAPMTFTKQKVASIGWLPQTANLVDTDNDGDLDYFLCNDEGNNLLLENDGTGSFQPSDIEFFTSVDSLNAGNYGSVWTDIDSDGYLDLYIAKCKAGISDPTDPRRVNQLFINDGQGGYTENAAAFGLADGAQSWSVDAGDVDNDGDMDLFITNHSGPHGLYINNGTTFELFADLSMQNYALEGHFYDIDNNGWLDIITSDGNQNQIAYNDAMQFTLSTWGETGNGAKTMQLFDANQDGFADIWCQYTGKDITSGENYRSDKILLNSGNGNHFITFSWLADATKYASKLWLKGAFGLKTREIHLGSSYGHQRGAQVDFGLGSVEQVDSLVVIWSDGSRQVYDLSERSIDAHYIINPNGCISERKQIIATNDGYLCSSSTLSLTAKPNRSVLWSNQDTLASISVDAVGNYRYTYLDEAGCMQYSQYQNVLTDSIRYKELLDYDTNMTICADLPFMLDAVPSRQYLWSTGDTTQTIAVANDGTYAVMMTSACGDTFTSKNIHVSTLEPEELVVVGDSIMIGEQAVLTSNNEHTLWSDGTIGKELVTESLSESTTYYAQRFVSEYTKKSNIGLNKSIDYDKYSNDILSGGLLFSVSAPIIIRSFQVETDKAGVRKIVILRDEAVIAEKIVDIPVGVSRIAVDFSLDAGNYIIRTDNETNESNFGHRGPHLVRNQSAVSYPYKIGEELSIYGSTNGDNRYFYFYDWEVEHDWVICYGEEVPVEVYVRPTTTVDINKPISIYPNPVTETIHINAAEPINAIEVYDLQGRRIFTQKDGSTVTIPKNLTNGHYVLKVNFEHREYKSIIFSLNR